MAAYQESLTGPQAEKFGALPKIPIPGDDETLLLFAKNLLEVLKDTPIYRRDNVPVWAYTAKQRIEIMSAQSFRTFVDQYVACFKQKYEGQSGEPYDVVRSINKETAQGVLEAVAFWSGLKEIVVSNPVPMPTLQWDDAGPVGEISLLKPGYDEAGKTLTFE